MGATLRPFPLLWFLLVLFISILVRHEYFGDWDVNLKLAHQFFLHSFVARDEVFEFGFENILKCGPANLL